MGQGGAPDGTLAVRGNGDVSLDASTKLSMFIDQPGTTPSTDYSQLTASGTVNLGGATLNLSGSPSTCSLHPGDVDTLITTTGSLTGTFAGIPDGTVIPIFSCSGGLNASVRINYTAHSVTATVPGGNSGVPVNTSLPTISGTPQPGQTLTEHRRDMDEQPVLLHPRSGRSATPRAQTAASFRAPPRRPTR